MVLDNMDTELDTLTDNIYKDLMDFTNNTANDDITLLILEVDPNYASFRAEINQGISLYNSQKYDEAIPHLTKAYNLKKDHLRVLQALGRTYFKMREYNKSIDFYQKYVKVDDTDAGTFYNLGTCYYYTGDYEKSIEMNKKAVQRARNFVHAHFNLGIAYKKVQKKEEALKEFRTILELEPTHKHARQELKALAQS